MPGVVEFWKLLRSGLGEEGMALLVSQGTSTHAPATDSPSSGQLAGTACHMSVVSLET